MILYLSGNSFAVSPNLVTHASTKHFDTDIEFAFWTIHYFHLSFLAWVTKSNKAFQSIGFYRNSLSIIYYYAQHDVRLHTLKNNEKNQGRKDFLPMMSIHWHFAANMNADDMTTKSSNQFGLVIVAFWWIRWQAQTAVLIPNLCCPISWKLERGARTAQSSFCSYATTRRRREERPLDVERDYTYCDCCYPTGPPHST